jgi:hypothetical protein
MKTPEEKVLYDAKEAFLSDGGCIKRFEEQTCRDWNFDEGRNFAFRDEVTACLERFSVGDTTEDGVPTVDPYILERPPSLEEPAE